ncbi:MAG: hypothetical protein COA74_04910 [Gammaproteobacteria bacterium]|nr:MAG: hypothetical protein COA74_04910 [Gammaproteobacteria bacterium]
MNTLTKCLIIVWSLALISACGGGSSASDTQPVTNVAPIANTGTDISTDENTTVTLDGSSSTDSDGSIASYAWVQTSGTNVGIANANQSTATFTAPDVNTDTQLAFQLTVTDDDGATNSDTIAVSILDAAGTNQVPTAVAGNNFSADENTTVTLDGSSSSDPDGTIANYAWAQTTGAPTVSITNSTFAVASFTAPDITINTPLTFELTVTDNDGATNSSSVVVTITPLPGPAPLLTDVRSFIFGHSLVNHTFGGLSNDLTNTPRWINELALEAGYTYAATGQFGFGAQHVASLPTPESNWNLTPTPISWDSSTQTFAEGNINVTMFTPANFRQEFAANESSGNWPDVTTDTTAALFNWAENEAPGNSRYIIYENWQDMGPYTSANFSSTFPTTGELANYWATNNGSFHDWWIHYHDVMMAQNPELNVRMIPVGYIMGIVLTTTLVDIPAIDLYEDNAPHGRPTLYFLAGLITYMGTYGIEAPADYVVPNTVHSLVLANYTQIVSEIWAELQNFNDLQGNSRVFPN